MVTLPSGPPGGESQAPWQSIFDFVLMVQSFCGVAPRPVYPPRSMISSADSTSSFTFVQFKVSWLQPACAADESSRLPASATDNMMNRFMGSLLTNG